jgi:DNA-binding MurR/RpiR family transcriptional regulator
MSVVIVVDMTGMPIVTSVPVEHTLLDLQALGTHYTRHNHYLIDLDDGSEYRPYCDELYEVKRTDNPKFMVITLLEQTTHAIESIYNAEDPSAIVQQVQILCDDKDVVLTAIRHYPYELYDGGVLKYASHELQDDRNIVLKAVQVDGTALEWASSRLQADKGVVLAAILHTKEALRMASKAMREDEEVIMIAVQQHGDVLKYASTGIQNNKGVVLAAVSQCGYALEWASPVMKNDREVVMTAVQQCGYALEWASTAMQSDEGIVMAARGVAVGIK